LVFIREKQVNNTLDEARKLQDKYYKYVFLLQDVSNLGRIEFILAGFCQCWMAVDEPVHHSGWARQPVTSPAILL
jgi:hypothetical protein